MDRITTEWIVITGAPSSGKTTVMKALQERGHLVMPEPAEMCITTRLALGELLPDICGPHAQARLQQEILAKALELQHSVDPSETCFFDRTSADCIAYCTMYGLDPAPFIEATKRFAFKRIFMLDRMDVQPNGIRIEDNQSADQLDKYTEDAYRTLDYDVTRIPVVSVQERVEFILKEVLETHMEEAA